MSSKRTSAKRPIAPQNPRTGSYTIYVPKDARTGTFASSRPKPGKIIYPPSDTSTGSDKATA